MAFDCDKVGNIANLSCIDPMLLGVNLGLYKNLLYLHGQPSEALLCFSLVLVMDDGLEEGHTFGSELKSMWVVKPKTASIFSGLGKHGGTPPIAPDSVALLEDASRFMVVFYCPRSILSPDGNSIPFASLPNGMPLTLGPEITAPLCDIFLNIIFI